MGLLPNVSEAQFIVKCSSVVAKINLCTVTVLLFPLLVHSVPYTYGADVSDWNLRSTLTVLKGDEI